jgi:hypothetical protein
MVLAGAAALSFGTWRLWALVVLMWSLYELCFCPTSCGIVTRGENPCRRGVHGRLFACTEDHQRVKTDALWRPAGHHRPVARVAHGEGSPPAHRRARMTPVTGTVELRHRVITYAAVLGLVAAAVQSAVGLA